MNRQEFLKARRKTSISRPRIRAKPFHTESGASLRPYTVGQNMICQTNNTRHYGNTVDTGQPGANGALETNAFLSILFEKSNVPEFSCGELYCWLVFYVMDTGDNLPLQIIDAPEALCERLLTGVSNMTDAESKSVKQLKMKDVKYSQISI
ncbi:MAG: hypothetical protein JWM28_2115 [Chitinophagaceae bacterium]|nr:hypothetical protein [Chitinophagaceae bacterium]